MSKTAAIRKDETVKKSSKMQAKTKTATKKPQLKVVTSQKTKAKSKATVAKQAQPKAEKAKLKVVTKNKAQLQAKALAKPSAKAVSRPVAQPVSKVLPPVVSPTRKLESKKIEARRPEGKKEFRVGAHVVYPTHGVGKIVAEEVQMIGDHSIRMFVIAFEKDRMTLRVPMHRATAAGLRYVSSGTQMQQVYATLKSKAKIARGMWSRRAQEYETKINSGNIILIAEVVRDLHQNVDQAERSYSERMIYESALGRLVGELAASEGMDSKAATDKLLVLLRSKVAA